MSMMHIFMMYVSVIHESMMPISIMHGSACIYEVDVYDKYIFNMFIYVFIYIFDSTTTSHIDVVSFIGALVVVTGYDPIHPNNLSIPALTA